MQENDLRPTSRRHFLSAVAAGTAAFSLTTLATPLSAGAKTVSENLNNTADDPDQWFNQIKGKHRIVFDVTEPHDKLPFAWSRVFLLTNAGTGTTEKDNSVVVILRHEAIPFAMQDQLWAKYKFGEMFKVKDPATQAASVRNPFWKPKAGDFRVPGIGPVAIGINELQDSGVMFCVCNMALTVYSSAVSQMNNVKQEDVYNEWKKGLLPGVQIVPSGVWAVGRAQEHGCAYCFAG